MWFHAVYDRVLIVKLVSTPLNIVIIQVYAPTSACSEDEIEKFYSDLESAYTQCGSQDMNVVMVDLKVKVGQGQDPLREVGGRRHGLDRRNERGDM